MKSVTEELGKRYKFSNYLIDPNKFRLRKVLRTLALVMLFIRNVKKRLKITLSNNDYSHQIAVTESEDIPVKFVNDENIVTTGKAYEIGKHVIIQSKLGLVINLSENDLAEALNYFYIKASREIRHFLSPKLYTKISYEDDGILYYKG